MMNGRRSPEALHFGATQDDLIRRMKAIRKHPPVMVPGGTTDRGEGRPVSVWTDGGTGA